MINAERPPQWSEEILYSSGDAYYHAIFQAISQAKHTVDLETYIFEDDELGKRLLFELMNASRRGVRVRLLVDGAGSILWWVTPKNDLRQAGVETRVYHPIPWAMPFSFIYKKFNKSMALFSRINQRNHRKTVLIDGETAFVGSFNVSANHSATLKGPNSWRDSGVQLKGTGVGDLVYAFERAFRGSWPLYRVGRWLGQIPTILRWGYLGFYSGSKSLTGASQPHPLVRLNMSFFQRRKNYQAFLDQIENAKKRVWITNAYFVPHGSLTRALHRAAQSGADVRMLFPKNPDIIFIKWVRSAFYLGLLNAGVKIFEYGEHTARNLHAKTALIDDWALIGSSNLNHRSLFHDLEVDVILMKPGSVATLEEDFIRDRINARAIGLEDWWRSTRITRFVGRVLLLLRYYM